MLSKVKSCGLLGIDGYIVEVETDISNGMPGFEKVGDIVKNTQPVCSIFNIISLLNLYSLQILSYNRCFEEF